MTVKELNVGDVFRIAGETVLWRKVNPREAHQTGPPVHTPLPNRVEFGFFRGKEIEIVERAGEICRTGNTLVLRGGEITLEFVEPLLVHRCTPGEPFTEIVFAGGAFQTSRAERPTEQTALMFTVGAGGKHLGRSRGSELYAYGGRIYVRATKKEVTGERKKGGYRLVRKIDGARRLVVMGVTCIPNEFSLYDIMMEHFGPDTVPR